MMVISHFKKRHVAHAYITFVQRGAWATWYNVSSNV